MPVLTLESPVATKSRIISIDLLRGLVMVIMALDHTRDFFHVAGFTGNPTDLATTTPFLFFTRWITHFCAPIFVFLAGTSAFLYGHRGKTKRELFMFLLSRGLWLILLEITIINFAFWFNIHFETSVFQVIWSIGASMICLAGLVFLPYPAILFLGLLIVFGHNALDSIVISKENAFYTVWTLLHQPGALQVDQTHTIYVMYPMLPWLGVMMLGYCFGKLYQNNWQAEKRQKLLWQMGLGIIILFFALRGLNIYGDPAPWQIQPTVTFTILSFFNTTKYPPSLLYILMTIGPGLLFLAFIENKSGELLRVFHTFGRVPLFYYVLHFYLIHLLAMLTALSAGYTWSDFNFSTNPGGLPPGFGYNLARVYLIWICIIALLYPICKKYNQYKSQHKHWWLSYM